MRPQRKLNGDKNMLAVWRGYCRQAYAPVIFCDFVFFSRSFPPGKIPQLFLERGLRALTRSWLGRERSLRRPSGVPGQAEQGVPGAANSRNASMPIAAAAKASPNAAQSRFSFDAPGRPDAPTPVPLRKIFGLLGRDDFFLYHCNRLPSRSGL